MARRTTRRKRDDTWVVKDDEFHPDVKVAARNADRQALVAAAGNNRQDIGRIVHRSELVTAGSSEHAALAAERARLEAETRRIEQAIKDHDTTEEDA